MTAGADLRLLRAAVFTVVCVALSMAGHTVAAGAPVPLWTVGVACALVFAVAAPLSGRERSLRGIVALLALAQVALHTLFSGGTHGGSPAVPGLGQAGAHAGHGGSTGGTDGGGLRELAGQLLCNDGAAAALTDAQARRVISDSGLSGTPTAYAPDLSHGASATAGLTVDCLRGAVSHALHQLTPVMLLGHLLAALTVGWLLSRGETALWRLIRLSATMATTAEELVTVRDLRTALFYVRALRAGLLPDTPAPRRTAPAHDETVARPVLLHHTVSRRGPPHSTGSLALAA